jgi:hypothetical protein
VRYKEKQSTDHQANEPNYHKGDMFAYTASGEVEVAFAMAVLLGIAVLSSKIGISCNEKSPPEALPFSSFTIE